MPIGIGTGLAIGAAGAVASAGIGAYASSQASSAQASAAQNALSMQQQIYGQNSANMQPYMNLGSGASNSLAQLYGIATPGNPGGGQGVNSAWDAFTNLPAYQFPLQQGMTSLTRNLNAQGLTQSGAQAKETQQYAQGLASQYMMSNYVQPLQSMSTTGAQAAGSLAGTSAQMANTMGQTTMGIGQAQASGIVGGANAITGGIGSATSSLNMYNYLSRMPGGNPAYSTSSYNTPTSLAPAGSLPNYAMNTTGYLY